MSAWSAFVTGTDADNVVPGSAEARPVSEPRFALAGTIARLSVPIVPLKGTLCARPAHGRNDGGLIAFRPGAPSRILSRQAIRSQDMTREDATADA